MLSSRKKSLLYCGNNNENKFQNKDAALPSIPMWIASNKINVVLDIDQTLLFSTICDINEIAEVKKNNPAIGETIHIYNYPLTQPKVIAIYIRPFAEQMLKTLSAFCNLYIYTKAIEPYAKHIANCLDPDSIYFKKILHKEYTNHNGYKALSKLFNEIECNKALIIDDSPDAWVHENRSHIIESINYVPFPNQSMKPIQYLWNSSEKNDQKYADLFTLSTYINEAFCKDSSQLNVLTEFIKSIYLEYVYSSGKPLHVVYRERVGKILSGQGFAMHISNTEYDIWNAVKLLIEMMGGLVKDESRKVLSVNEVGTIEYGYIIKCYYYKCALPIEDYIIK